jgi:excisionase family DNA binding protein
MTAIINARDLLPPLRGRTYITCQEAADLLGCHHTVVRKTINANVLAGYSSLHRRGVLVDLRDVGMLLAIERRLRSTTETDETFGQWWIRESSRA